MPNCSKNNVAAKPITSRSRTANGGAGKSDPVRKDGLFRQLTAGIAHEIKNPLNFVNNFADLSRELLDELKEQRPRPPAAPDAQENSDLSELVDTLDANLEKIVEHGRRADGIVTSMLLHSRGGSGERRMSDLNALIEEALDFGIPRRSGPRPGLNVTLQRELDPHLEPIEIVPQDLTRVFLNLFGNAFYAVDKRRREAARRALRRL